ncbi:MAG: ABC transporter ATP-binding protein [Ruminococcaceae bacterium]|nr:ABC transporter ATP-binding protein [Oscillospiraceae bacterium]
MSDTAIRAENVSMSFDPDSKRQVGLGGYWARLLKKKTSSDKFQMLNDISFKIKKGGSLAVIGAEGSGKTTLLKLAAGIITPTEGKIITKGSIGTVFAEDKGFDLSLSAKENIYIMGSLRGFTREYMKKRVDKIIDFAELEGFEGTPVKKLSHETSLRLAFSIVSHVKTDILILDEALSPCSAEFRAKCEKRIAKMKDSGTAVLSVSYLPDHISNVCENAIWIDNGEMMMYDTAQKVWEEYEKFCQES